jgi:hypothetical protein
MTARDARAGSPLGFHPKLAGRLGQRATFNRDVVGVHSAPPDMKEEGTTGLDRHPHLAGRRTGFALGRFSHVSPESHTCHHAGKRCDRRTDSKAVEPSRHDQRRVGTVTVSNRIAQGDCRARLKHLPVRKFLSRLSAPIARQRSGVSFLRTIGRVIRVGQTGSVPNDVGGPDEAG